MSRETLLLFAGVLGGSDTAPASDRLLCQETRERGRFVDALRTVVEVLWEPANVRRAGPQSPDRAQASRRTRTQQPIPRVTTVYNARRAKPVQGLNADPMRSGTPWVENITRPMLAGR